MCQKQCEITLILRKWCPILSLFSFFFLICDICFQGCFQHIIMALCFVKKIFQLLGIFHSFSFHVPFLKMCLLFHPRNMQTCSNDKINRVLTWVCFFFFPALHLVWFEQCPIIVELSCMWHVNILFSFHSPTGVCVIHCTSVCKQIFCVFWDKIHQYNSWHLQIVLTGGWTFLD